MRERNNELNWVKEWLNGSDLNFLVFTALWVNLLRKLSKRCWPDAEKLAPSLHDHRLHAHASVVNSDARGMQRGSVTWHHGDTAVHYYIRRFLELKSGLVAHVPMRIGWVKPKAGYFCTFWSCRFLFRSFVPSSQFCSAVMKTLTVTVSSSRPPPGKWFCAQSLRLNVIHC